MATTTSMDAHGASTPSTRSLFWTRFASFVSIFPLGVWVVNHLWDNLAAFTGAEAWERSVTHYAHPYSQFFTFVIVILPLILHAIWGVQRLFSFKPNITRYGNFGNLNYILQRITAVGAFFFIGAHIWMAMLRPRITEGRAEVFSDISGQMHFHAPTLIVYLLGTLAVAYHLANGVASFAWTWGLVAGRRSLARYVVLSVIVFLVLLAMAWGTLFAMYQAGANFPPTH
jgi:succinate dehydrogenase / fumarate reductase cytochrome b subunit